MKVRKISYDDESKDLIIPQAREFLIELSSLYPGIDHWWDTKVIPGIVSGERVCYAATEGNLFKALAIGKRSYKSAKLCSLRVAPDAIKTGIGTALIITTLSELISSNCESVHFTISDEIIAQHNYFFEKYGFKPVTWHNDLYVVGSAEFVYEAPASVIREAIKTQNDR